MPPFYSFRRRGNAVENSIAEEAGKTQQRKVVRDMDRKKEAPAEKGQEPVELGPGILIVLNAR